MAATELADFVETIQGTEYDGIKKVFVSEPPASLTTAQMPALWIQKATSSQRAIARAGTDWPEHAVEIWVVVKPISQVGGWLESLTLADTLRLTLANAVLGKAQPSVTVRTERLAVNEKAYWGLVATVEAQG